VKEMSEVKINEEYTTKLKDEQFLRFAENSKMGVIIIQRGFLQYFNHKFREIFGYSKREIVDWKKREFYKIIHPEDLSILVNKFKVEADKKTVSVRFRGVKKDKKIINIENYICHIYYNNKTAYLSSYISLEESFNKLYIPKLIKTKTERKIILNYHPDMVNLLENNNLKFEIIKHYSYRVID